MPEIKVDCFGYSLKAGKCAIMTETICKKRECSFYKTQEQYQEDKKKYEKGGDTLWE